MGIFVSGVQEGSPAEEQGIQEGDQILQVAGGGRVGMLGDALSPGLRAGVARRLGPHIVVLAITLVSATWALSVSRHLCPGHEPVTVALWGVTALPPLSPSP